MEEEEEGAMSLAVESLSEISLDGLLVGVAGCCKPYGAKLFLSTGLYKGTLCRKCQFLWLECELAQAFYHQPAMFSIIQPVFNA